MFNNENIILSVAKVGVYFTFFFVSIFINAQTKRAFLVGISEYPQNVDCSWNNIHGANDVDIISKTLKSQSFKITSITNHSASAKKIRNELTSFSKKCKTGEIVYIHFSCHGQPFEDLDGDENDGWDEALIPYDAQKVYVAGKYEGQNHILDDELNGYLKSIRSKIGAKGFVYVVIDACHAGSSYRGDDDSIIVRGTDIGFSKSNKAYTPRIDKRGKIKINKSANMADICVLEACRSYQVNTEIKENGKHYGPLSFYVNKTLQTTKIGKDKSWAYKVSQLLNQDSRLVRQNIVIETSL